MTDPLVLNEVRLEGLAPKLSLKNSVTVNAGRPDEIPAGTQLVNFNEWGDVIFGPNVGGWNSGNYDPLQAVMDGAFLQLTQKLHGRSLVIREVGDAPEMQLARAGGAYPNGPKLGCLSGEGGSWYSGVYVTPPGGTPGVTPGGRFTRISEAPTALKWHIREDARAFGDPAAEPKKWTTNAGGSWSFATRPCGSTGGPVDSLYLASTGAAGFVTGERSFGDIEQMPRGDVAVEGDLRVRFKNDAAGCRVGTAGPAGEPGVKFGDATIYKHADGTVRIRVGNTDVATFDLPPAQNLVPNPDADTSAAGFVGEDNVVTGRAAGEGVDGTYAFTGTLAAAGAACAGFRNQDGTYLLAAPGGYAYRAQIKTRANYGARTARLRVLFYTADGQEVGTAAGQSVALTTSYQQVALTVTVPAAAAKVRLVVDILGGLAGEQYDIDNVYFG